MKKELSVEGGAAGNNGVNKSFSGTRGKHVWRLTKRPAGLEEAMLQHLAEQHPPALGAFLREGASFCPSSSQSDTQCHDSHEVHPEVFADTPPPKPSETTHLHCSPANKSELY